MKVTLLYSAAIPSALLFHDRLDKISTHNRMVRSGYAVTWPHDEPWPDTWEESTAGYSVNRVSIATRYPMSAGRRP